MFALFSPDSVHSLNTSKKQVRGRRDEIHDEFLLSNNRIIANWCNNSHFLIPNWNDIDWSNNLILIRFNTFPFIIQPTSIYQSLSFRSESCLHLEDSNRGSGNSGITFTYSSLKCNHVQDNIIIIVIVVMIMSRKNFIHKNIIIFRGEFFLLICTIFSG